MARWLIVIFLTVSPLSERCSASSWSPPVSSATLLDGLSWALIAAGPALFLFSAKEYGSAAKDQPRWPVSRQWLWHIMEAPSLIFFGGLYFASASPLDPYRLIPALMWLGHYAHRTIIYPRHLAGKEDALLGVQGFSYNMMNSWINAAALGGFYGHEVHRNPALLGIGLAVYAAGQAMNKISDGHLQNLKAKSSGQYVLPEHPLFDYFVAPNLVGEIAIWTGYALATGQLAAGQFAWFTFCNLMVRSLAKDRWYRDKMGEVYAGRRSHLQHFPGWQVSS